MFINHLLCFYISVFRFSSICCLHVIISIFVVWDTIHQDVRSKHNFLVRSFWEISTYKIIVSKVSDLFCTSIYFSIEANTKFPDKAPSVIPNSKDTKFQKGGSRWSLHADLEAVVQNGLLSRCSLNLREIHRKTSVPKQFDRVGPSNIYLRILTGKKHPKITLQHLRKIRIWTFGSLDIKLTLFKRF